MWQFPLKKKTNVAMNVIKDTSTKKSILITYCD